MKVNRNYKFVLTSIPNNLLETGEYAILPDQVCGERMYTSECHYYAEKNILEGIKSAAKASLSDYLSDYQEHTYCIYKENKPKITEIEREEDGKKIKETVKIPGAAMLIEVITVDENGINIQ